MLYSIWLSDATPVDHIHDRVGRAGATSGGSGQLTPSRLAGPKNAGTRWRMLSRLLEWASITTMLLVLAWRPSVGRDPGLDLVVCAGVALLALTLCLGREAAPAAAGRAPTRRP
jgi:hypothetical protein